MDSGMERSFTFCEREPYPACLNFTFMLKSNSSTTASNIRYSDKCFNSIHDQICMHTKRRSQISYASKRNVIAFLDRKPTGNSYFEAPCFNSVNDEEYSDMIHNRIWGPTQYYAK